MEHFHRNNSSHNKTYSYIDYSNSYYNEETYYMYFYVAPGIIIAISLPLTLVGIYALFSMVRKDHIAPIYVINLLISDLIQLCCMIVQMIVQPESLLIIYIFGLMASVFFMVCISLERYLVIAWPLWYRLRRTIKISVVVCVVVWTFPLVCVLLFYFSDDFSRVSPTALGVFFLLPFPLLIFSLVGTIKALSAAISVRAEEKRRIVGLLVLVLLIYMVLFLPGIIWFLIENEETVLILGCVTFISFRLSPLADLFMYIFLRKGAVNKVLSCLCCFRKDRTSQTSSSEIDGNTHTVTSV
ncbi:G-protein coupled receptor 4-like [Anabas testudineus]|uniref:G-protein coupled receptor 4-like n=1 Tax=Anabas testudineus TaxID=64144 RepID=UPI000E456DFB|nr:G-protein coupled receptor 4-like [Anabas testudineus]